MNGIKNKRLRGWVFAILVLISIVGTSRIFASPVEAGSSAQQHFPPELSEPVKLCVAFDPPLFYIGIYRGVDERIHIVCASIQRDPSPKWSQEQFKQDADLWCKEKYGPESILGPFSHDGLFQCVVFPIPSKSGE